jgi:hypothetical protein
VPSVKSCWHCSPPLPHNQTSPYCEPAHSASVIACASRPDKGCCKLCPAYAGSSYLSANGDKPGHDSENWFDMTGIRSSKNDEQIPERCVLTDRLLRELTWGGKRVGSDGTLIEGTRASKPGGEKIARKAVALAPKATPWRFAFAWNG